MELNLVDIIKAVGLSVGFLSQPGTLSWFSCKVWRMVRSIRPPAGATYIYSSCEAFSEEMEIDFIRLAHWLDRFGISSCGFSLDDKGKPVFDPAYHASGHASREDLAWVIDQVDPEIIIPVHTLGREWFEKQFDRVVKVEEGVPLTV